jgi:hypothetical protein
MEIRRPGTLGAFRKHDEDTRKTAHQMSEVAFTGKNLFDYVD